MTIDERIMLLVQSSESLHATAHELTAQVQGHTAQIEQLPAVVREHTRQLETHTKQLEIDAENIRRLANIAASHEQRLDDLEGGNGPV